MVKSNYGNFCSRENHAHRVGPSQNCLLANSCQCIKYASLTLLIFLSGRFVSLKPEIRTYLFAKWHSTVKRPNKVCCESSPKKNVIRLQRTIKQVCAYICQILLLSYFKLFIGSTSRVRNLLESVLYFYYLFLQQQQSHVCSSSPSKS